MAFLAGFDIGGTQVRCAVADQDLPHEVLTLQSDSTPQGGVASVLDCTENLLHRCLLELNGRRHIVAAGCAAPGMTDVDSGVVLDAANLQDWTDVPLRELMLKRLNVPIAVANDVNAAALAEALVGYGLELSPLVYLTISTGVAAGIVIGGEILHGAHYCAGEIGTLVPERQYLSDDWRPNGCLELTAAGIGLGREWADLRGGEATPRRAREVFAAADARDPYAIALVERAQDYLAQAAVAIAGVLDPACIVIGGSIGLKRPAIQERIQAVLEHTLKLPPLVVPSKLGEHAPIIGALQLAARSVRS